MKDSIFMYLFYIFLGQIEGLKYWIKGGMESGFTGNAIQTEKKQKVIPILPVWFKQLQNSSKHMYALANILSYYQGNAMNKNF